MQWLDIVVIITMVTIMVVEGKRGFGKGLFDLVGIILAAELARSLAAELAPMLRLFGAPGTNEAFLLGGIFMVLAAAFVFLARWLYDVTLISLDSFDNVFGALIGLATGVAVIHVLVLALLLGSAPAKGQQLRQTRVCREFVGFETYKGVIKLLENLGR